MKQLWALILVIAALLGILAGCGTAKSSSNNNQKKEEQNTPKQEEKEQEEQEEVSSSSEDSMYQSAIKLYINNSNSTLEDMIPTYIEIIKSNDVIKNVKEKCPDAEFTLSAERLDASGIIQVTVYSETKEDLQAAKDHVTDEICRQIPSVVEGATCKIVDYGTISTGEEVPKPDQDAFIRNAAYKHTVKFYANTSNIPPEGTSLDISSSDETASMSIVQACITIIRSNSVMNNVKAHCAVALNTAGACYESIDDLEEFAIRVEQVENTQIVSVTVYAEKEAFTRSVANAFAEVVPEAISKIIEGTSCKVVDSGITEKND